MKKTGQFSIGVYLKIFVSALLCLISHAGDMACAAEAAKEVGDIVYQFNPENPQIGMWGRDQYDTHRYAGHALIYIGKDEKSQDWFIEAAPNGYRDDTNAMGIQRWRVDVRFPVIGFYTPQQNMNSEIRKNIVKNAFAKFGKPYTPWQEFLRGGFGGTPEQKGPNKWTCVGLSERCYEEVGVDLTPDGIGRCLWWLPTCSCNLLKNDANWMDRELSHVYTAGFVNGYIMYPYTQWYHQIHREYGQNIPRLRLSISQPTIVNLLSPNPEPSKIETLCKQTRTIYTIRARANDGLNGSGIFKVEFYLDAVYPTKLIGKVYTHTNSDGSPKMFSDVKYSGSQPIFYYENGTTLINLPEYKFEWNYSDLAAGYYKIIARAVDRAGNWAQDKEATIHIINNPPQDSDDIMWSSTSEHLITYRVDKVFKSDEISAFKFNPLYDFADDYKFDMVSYVPKVNYNPILPYQGVGPYKIAAAVIDYDDPPRITNNGNLIPNPTNIRKIIYTTDADTEWHQVDMVLQPDNPGVLGDEFNYEASIPALPSGTLVTYYIQAVDAAGNIGTSPETLYGNSQPSDFHQFTVDTEPPKFIISGDNNPFSPNGDSIKDTVLINWQLDDISNFVNNLRIIVKNDGGSVGIGAVVRIID